MDKVMIEGGAPLKGTIQISGAKNAVLPLMAAGLLTEQALHLRNVPDLADVRTISKLLSQHGAGVSVLKNGEVTIEAKDITNLEAPYDLVRTMRASVLVLGPLLARFGKARISLPGGCAIGTRPIDLHLHALEKMGAEIELDAGYVEARAPSGLKGADIVFEKVSVGATENILMAAALAKGTTRLQNAAREPEVTDLANCLVKMGAKIEGIGRATMEIEGVDALGGATHDVVADRIETGSFIAAAGITGGQVTLTNTNIALLPGVIEAFEDIGIRAVQTDAGVEVTRCKEVLQAHKINTQPYPGFPTDMQAQMMALLTLAEGASMISETIFENRFMHVPELIRMGADISVDGHMAVVKGVKQLKAAHVMATDLRASFSLIIAALAAKGTTELHRIYHLDRGYEKIEAKLSGVGAKIWREKEQAA